VVVGQGGGLRRRPVVEDNALDRGQAHRLKRRGGKGTTRQAGLDLRAAGMKAMAGAAMATRVAAKNFMVEECEVCGVVDGGEGGRGGGGE